MDKLRWAAVKALAGGLNASNIRKGVMELLESGVDAARHILQVSTKGCTEINVKIPI